MNKTIMRRLLLALAGACALDLRAAPAWTTTDVEPASWTALSGNLIVHLTGTKSGTISTGYGTTDMGVLTDGVVPTVNGNESRVAFQNTGAVEWSFTTPKTLEQVRVSGCYLGGSTYTRISISAVYVKLFGSDTWTELDGSSFLDNSGRSQNVVVCASLADPGTGYLAQGVAGLKVAFGANVPLASYIVEIEAVGSAEATGPVLGSFDIAPAKTKATVSGSIVDVGTDATACDVYLALDGGAATKIAEDVTGSFEYRLQGLAAGTEYAYELSVSNNAATAKGTVRSGTFSTLAADASAVFWTTVEGVPGDFSPLANNLLANKSGTASGGSISGYGGGVDLLTDGAASGVTKQTCGFRENMTVEWSFGEPRTLETIRFTTSDIPDGRQYDDIKISKVEVTTSGADSWTDLGAEPLNYAGSNAGGTALFATLADAETGFLAQNATALRITFGKPNNVAQYYAEIEAVGQAEPEKGKLVIFVQ